MRDSWLGLRPRQLSAHVFALGYFLYFIRNGQDFLMKELYHLVIQFGI